MKKKQFGHGPAEYRIEVKGNLGSNWTDWFDGMIIDSEAGVTTITALNMDQAALHGLLIRIRDLGLPLISLKRIDMTNNTGPAPIRY